MNVEIVRDALDGGVPLLHREDRMARRLAAENALDAVVILQHNTRRMLQALDAYWMNYEGRPFNKMPRGKYTAEDWWHRYEKYRKLVEADL